MAVCVEMNHSIAMTMGVEMHPIAPQPPEHVDSEPDHHDTNCALKRLRDMFRNCVPQEDGRPRKQRERNGVAKPPCQPVPDDVTNIGPAGSDTGDSCDVIGFQRVLHPQHETKPQNSKHTQRSSLTADYIRKDGLAKSFSELSRKCETNRQRLNRMKDAIHHAGLTDRGRW